MLIFQRIVVVLIDDELIRQVSQNSYVLFQPKHILIFVRYLICIINENCNILKLILLPLSINKYIARIDNNRSLF